jgi:hypothetical protein
MRPPVRVAGVATLDDGTEITWSVADGRRGRRWRATTRRRGSLTIALLLEVGTDGRATRLELATAVGLLTLHPEPDGQLHGNAVTAEGVRHLHLPWSGDHAIEVEPIPIADAITAAWLAGRLGSGEGTDVPTVVVGADLVVRDGVRRFTRIDATTWRVEADGTTRRRVLDDRGVPVWTGETGEPSVGGEWPLELDDPV